MIPLRILDTIISYGTPANHRIVSTDPAIQVDIEVWEAAAIHAGTSRSLVWRSMGKVSGVPDEVGWHTRFSDLPGRCTMADVTSTLMRAFYHRYGFEPDIWLVEEQCTYKETVGDLVQYVRKNMHHTPGWEEAMAIEPRPTPDFPREALPPWFEEGAEGCPQPGSCDRPVYNPDDYPPLP